MFSLATGTNYRLLVLTENGVVLLSLLTLWWMSLSKELLSLRGRSADFI